MLPKIRGFLISMIAMIAVFAVLFVMYQSGLFRQVADRVQSKKEPGVEKGLLLSSDPGTKEAEVYGTSAWIKSLRGDTILLNLEDERGQPGEPAEAYKITGETKVFLVKADSKPRNGSVKNLGKGQFILFNVAARSELSSIYIIENWKDWVSPPPEGLIPEEEVRGKVTYVENGTFMIAKKKVLIDDKTVWVNGSISDIKQGKEVLVTGTYNKQGAFVATMIEIK